MDYEPTTTTPGTSLHRDIVEKLAPLQSHNLMDPFVLAQVQAVLEDSVRVFRPTAGIRLLYTDAASLLAVYEVDGMMLSTIRVVLATPDPTVIITYKPDDSMTAIYNEANTCGCGCGLAPGHYDKKDEQETE